MGERVGAELLKAPGYEALFAEKEFPLTDFLRRYAPAEGEGEAEARSGE